VYLLVYVNDIQIASKNASDVEHVKQLVTSAFKGRDQGETQVLLRMPVHRDRSRRLLVLCNQRHVDQLVQASGLGTACPKSLPMMTGVYNDPIDAEITDLAIVPKYRSLVGAIMHISSFTRPDVAFAVSYLARFMHRPTARLFARVQDLICYLKGTASYGFYLGGASPQCRLNAYCDSHYANCREDRRSVTGLVVKCGVESFAGNLPNNQLCLGLRLKQRKSPRGRL
jgi:hypothetical protein